MVHDDDIAMKQIEVRRAVEAYGQARALAGSVMDPRGEKSEESMRDFLRVFGEYERLIAPWLTDQRCCACGVLATKYRSGPLLYVGHACDACYVLPRIDWWKKVCENCPPRRDAPAPV